MNFARILKIVVALLPGLIEALLAYLKSEDFKRQVKLGKGSRPEQNALIAALVGALEQIVAAPPEKAEDPEKPKKK